MYPFSSQISIFSSVNLLTGLHSQSQTFINKVVLVLKSLSAEGCLVAIFLASLETRGVVPSDYVARSVTILMIFLII